MTTFQFVNRAITLVVAGVALALNAMQHIHAAFLVACMLVGWMWKANWRDGASEVGNG